MQEFGPCTVNSCHRVSSGYASSGVPCLRSWRTFVFVVILFPVYSFALNSSVIGTVSDPTGRPIADASVELVDANGALRVKAVSGSAEKFQLAAPALSECTLIVKAAGFQTVSKRLVNSPEEKQYQVTFSLAIRAIESVIVTADVNHVDLFSPDPAEKVFVQQDLIDANPSRPGAPVSIPGYPIETASGGIKAPQYFAPGVAGDHGEPIAQFIAVGSYLLPNSLSANAHGNGYADPNILVPATLADVHVDGGSFNVLEANHSVNLAATYALRQQIDPFFTITGDYRDIDLAAAVSPGNTSWVTIEASYGNGFLRRLEHRQQYKINGERVIEAGQHRFTILGIGYFGSSYIPGLVPIGSSSADYPNVGDTVDPRQKEQTHTALMALNDE